MSLSSFRARVAAARHDGALYFASLVPEQLIDELLGDARGDWRGWIYRPALVVWCFLSQVLSSDHSCRETVAKLNAYRVAHGLSPCSADTGAYCLARDKLPEAVCHELIHATAHRVMQDVPQSWLWCGRRVRVVDGSTVTMPDTPANRAEYPQVPGQKPGCGFPIVRLVVIFCLATGAVLEMALGKYKGKQTGENSLFRSLSDVLEPRDVVLADRCYSGWFDIVLLALRGIDVAMRRHHARQTDLRRGQRLGEGDHLVMWVKPTCPEWMEQTTYDALPNAITVREVCVLVCVPGFRTREVVVVTTLTNADEYSSSSLACLYRQRWHGELNLRSIKTVMQMDHARCLKPHRVRNELRMHLVAYNLIRELMVEAARSTSTQPNQTSFKGTIQTLNQFLPHIHAAISISHWVHELIRLIAAHRVGDRPDRLEPRVRKRRPKGYPLMTKPRNDYKTPTATSTYAF